METLPALWCVKSNNLEASQFYDKQRESRCYLRMDGTVSFESGYLWSINDRGESILGKPGNRSASYHRTTIPQDAVELTAEQFRRLVLQEQYEPVINNHYSII